MVIWENKRFPSVFPQKLFNCSLESANSFAPSTPSNCLQTLEENDMELIIKKFSHHVHNDEIAFNHHDIEIIIKQFGYHVDET